MQLLKKDKKKAFEYYILKRFFKTDIGKKYATSNVVFSEHPDFIVNNEKIEIAAVTDSENHKEYASYEKFVKSISSMVSEYFKREISFHFVLRRDKDIKYSKINKKELSNELIYIIRNKLFAINEDGISCISIYCNDKYKEYKNIYNCFAYISFYWDISFGYVCSLKARPNIELIKEIIAKKEEKYSCNRNEEIILLLYANGDILFSEKELKELEKGISNKNVFKHIYLLYLNTDNDIIITLDQKKY